MKTDIFILTKCKNGLVHRALKSVAATAKLSDIGKVIVGYTGDVKTEMQQIEQTLTECKLQHAVEQLEYNFAKNNNFLARKHARNEAVLFMNDDVELIDDCIGECLRTVSKNSIGTAGVKLLYRDKTVQHAGLYVAECKKDYALAGVGHIGARMPDSPMKAVCTAGSTGAFLMLKTDLFMQLGGFDERFKVCFEDVLLNLKAIAAGRRNITCNNVCAWHDESQTRGRAIDINDMALLAAEYSSIREDVLCNSVSWLARV